MRGAALVVCLGACGRIAFDPVGPAGDAAGTADLDLDGIPDGVDNCPGIANPDQANEDGDRFGDVCDPCPPFADGAVVLDQDSDGVADACDPNPGIPGDHIAVFEGFVHAPTGGPEIDGTWNFSGGQASAPSSLNAVSALTWTMNTNSETVSTHVTIDALFGIAVARPTGVVHELAIATADGTICVFGVNPSNAQVFALADNASTSALAADTTTATVGSAMTIASTRVGTSYACKGTGPGTLAPLSASNSLVSTPNRVGLFTRSVSATYDWLMIVTSP